MSITFSDLKTQALARADMVNSNFIGTDELNFYVNFSYKELYDLVVKAYDDYFTTSLAFTLTSNDSGYSVPDTVYKLRGVDRQIAGPNQWASVQRFNFADRNKFNSPWSILATNTIFPGLSYNWVGSQIQLIPQANIAGNYRLWYIPDVTPLVNDDDSILADLEPWADYIIVDTAIKCLAKEESDPSVFLMQKNALKDRIEAMAPNRDDALPKVVQDSSSWGGFPWGGNGGPW